MSGLTDARLNGQAAFNERHGPGAWSATWCLDTRETAAAVVELIELRRKAKKSTARIAELEEQLDELQEQVDELMDGLRPQGGCEECGMSGVIIQCASCGARKE